MSDKPVDRAWVHRPLRVAIETEPGNRNFVIDPRCEVVELLLGSDDQISRTVVNVWPGPTLPSAGSEAALSPADVLNGGHRPGFGTFISPSQEIFIVLEKPGDDESDQWEPVFSGFCKLPSYIERSSRAGTQTTIQFHVTGMLDQLSDMSYAQIIGRYMRNPDAQKELLETQARNAADSIGDRGDVMAVPSLPCIFNAGGKPNCAAAPITAQIGDTEIDLHVFTFDGDPAAVQWTWAKALRYLLYFHLYSDPTGEPSAELILDGNLFNLTNSLIGSTSIRPPAPADYEQAWDYAALGQPSNFAVDGMNLPEALIVATDQAGIHFWCKTEIEEGMPVNKLYFWARGAGTIKDLHREAVASSWGIDAQQILERNDFNGIKVRVDYRDALEAPMVVGDVRRYEITQELVPGWLPIEDLDNIEEEQRQTKLDWALEHQGMDEIDLITDPWYRRYHRSGAEFADYAMVGRRWIVNMSGLYPARSHEDAEGEEEGKERLYSRSVGPFDDDKYEPWDPTDCNITDTLIGNDGKKGTYALDEGFWSLRARPFLPCFSADAEGRSLGIVVEISFDSGSTWCRCANLNTRALADDSGIYFDCEDLTYIFAPGDDEGTSFWEAYLYGTARVRVTCVIEGDERVLPNLNATLFGVPEGAALTRQFDVSERFKSNRRDGGNSQFKSGGTLLYVTQTEEARDDIEALQNYVDHLLEICSARQQATSIQVPWLTLDMLPGDALRSIVGWGFDFNAHALTAQRRYPDVVGVIYNGSYTSIMLDDFRLLEELDGLPTTGRPDRMVATLPAMAFPEETGIAMV